jgi:hypothetical protein
VIFIRRQHPAKHAPNRLLCPQSEITNEQLLNEKQQLRWTQLAEERHLPPSILKRPGFLAKLVMGVHDRQTAKTLECGKEWPMGSTIYVRQFSKGPLYLSPIRSIKLLNFYRYECPTEANWKKRPQRVVHTGPSTRDNIDFRAADALIPPLRTFV